MTGHLAKAIEDCRRHAAHCACKAKTALDRESREDFLRLEQSWRRLARSYEVAQALIEDSNDDAA